MLYWEIVFEVVFTSSLSLGGILQPTYV